MGIDTATRMNATEFTAWVARSENLAKSWELVKGEVIEMPPPGRFHGTICFLIAWILGNYLFQRGSGSLCTNDSGLLVSRNPDSLRGPDLMVFLNTESLDRITRSFSEVVPDLIVEVFSPHDRWSEMNERVTEFLELGVPLVWVVEPESRAITVHRPREFTKILDGQDELDGNGVLPEFRCRVADLFALPGQ